MNEARKAECETTVDEEEEEEEEDGVDDDDDELRSLSLCLRSFKGT